MLRHSHPRARAVAVLLAAAAAVLVGTMAASAQDLPIGTTTTSSDGTTTTAPEPFGEETTTTTASSTTTTTTSTTTTTTTTSTTLAPSLPSTGDDPTTTTTAPSKSSGDPAPPVPPGDGDGEAPPPGVDAGPFPPELAALRDSVVRSGSNNTRALLAALAPLTELGVSAEEIHRVGFGRFPIAGYATYSHDWWFPRFGPGWRLHEGTDVFAAMGTPVRAPVDGVVRITNGGLGGLSVYVVQDDRTYWYLAHLSGIAEGLAEGDAVTTGDIVGFVGDSGNARGGAPHVHFEVHPHGGGPIDPKPILDQFIADALNNAPKVVEAYRAAVAADEPAPPPAAIAPPRAPDLEPLVAPRSALLWASSVSPAGGALQLAEAEAAAAVAAIDWDQRLREQQERVAAEAEVARRVHAWLDPLTPPLLREVLAGGVVDQSRKFVNWSG